MPFYAVAIGPRPGIYTSWPECQKAAGYGTKVYSRYKKFDTEEEAKQFIKENQGGNQSFSKTTSQAKTSGPPQRKGKNYTGKILGIWTDGSAQLYKKATSAFVAGIFASSEEAFSCGKKDESDLIMKETFVIEEQPFTAQHAEVAALYAAFNRVVEEYNKDQTLFDCIEVYSDSEFSVNTLNTWGPNRRTDAAWEGKAYADMFREMLQIINAFRSNDIPVVITHINSHIGIPYNELADKLAGEALKTAPTFQGKPANAKSAKKEEAVIEDDQPFDDDVYLD